MAPNPPALVPVQNSSSRKRHADESAAPATKRTSKTPDVVFRLLVPAGKIGKLIGKQGCQIKQLRDETLAHIKIADPVTNMEDRAVLISSRDELTSEKTCAEVALLRVATILLEDREGAPSATVGPQHQGSPNLTRLLISGSQAGSLIGKGGATIRDIRESSSASVRILPSDQLPLCSAATETDRLVQISGDLLAVERALELVATKLRENPPKEPVIVSAARPPPYFLGTAGPQMLFPFPMAYGIQPTPFGGLVGQTPLAQSSPLYGNAAGLSVMPKVTSEMSIPSALMGGLIGRGGANISQIRSASGASIKVHGTKERSADRSICFEGTEEQVALAQNMVKTFLQRH